MARERTRKRFVDEGFGFPVVLRNVPMVTVRSIWTPRINYNKLTRDVALALARKPARLTGHEIRFIRQHGIDGSRLPACNLPGAQDRALLVATSHGLRNSPPPTANVDEDRTDDAAQGHRGTRAGLPLRGAVEASLYGEEAPVESTSPHWRAAISPARRPVNTAVAYSTKTCSPSSRAAARQRSISSVVRR